jgi:dipeptidase D
VVDKVQEAAFLFETNQLATTIKNELKSVETDLTIKISPAENPKNVMSLGVQEGIIKAIYAAHNGVYAMSHDMEDLVETSNNVARVQIKEGKIFIGCLTRSSVESAKLDLANKLRATFELAGCEVTYSGSYPGWKPNVNSEILEVLKEKYETLFNHKPHIAACHAGLECGILKEHYPNMDMISYGPTIQGAHSPDERASISSVQKFWKFTKAILEAIPKK